MSFQMINRRVHLYLGMFLLPWVLMYAISSLVFSHMAAIRSWDGRETPSFAVAWEKDLDVQVPEGADLRVAGAEILEKLGVDSPFFARRQGNTINFLLAELWSRGRLTYDMSEKKAVLRTLEPRWYQLLTGLHLKAGYQHDDFFSDLWAFALDLVCVGFLIWVASGLYLWWKIRRLRFWGVVTLSAGLAAFVMFMIGL